MRQLLSAGIVCLLLSFSAAAATPHGSAEPSRTQKPTTIRDATTVQLMQDARFCMNAGPETCTMLLHMLTSRIKLDLDCATTPLLTTNDPLIAERVRRICKEGRQDLNEFIRRARHR